MKVFIPVVKDARAKPIPVNVDAILKAIMEENPATTKSILSFKTLNPSAIVETAIAKPFPIFSAKASILSVLSSKN